ncbi:hypothetical protein UA08_02014 [Talaromyces atroroseus]|uniref:Isotrichodermin C-15 hydroxylase n=1 Tax=Talaromyces atroroseus TaxID=1441469 RepID=A0A1Q5QCD0_TALAT|nr:hypothetical protein UA08_02014 [Talaromyces atroroseus]OKL63595.1 hypothetical protein UA08_02014 [Talaromyces atroroseus]
MAPPSLVLHLCSAVVLLLSTRLYRLLWHPLSKISGPILNAASSWPEFFAAASGDRHVRLWQLHEIYGPTVRIAPNRVSFNTVTAFKTIYDAKANVKQGPLYDTFIASNHGRVDLLDSDGEVHSRKRKIISHAFSERALRLKEDSIVEHQQSWLDQVTQTFGQQADDWTQPIDMTQWLSYMTIDIVGEIGFGKDFNLTRSERFRFLPQTFANLVTINFAVGHLPRALQFGINCILRSPIMSLLIPPEVHNFAKFTSDLIVERVARMDGLDSKENDDFVSLFRNQDGNLGKDAVEEIKSEATTLIVAGSDTAATAMAGMLFYLTHNPRCLEKLTAEIRSTFSTAQSIRRGYELSRAKYLRACIDETLRLSPPVPGYLGREVLAGGITIDGQYLPAGVEVGVPISALHLNPEYYPRPFEFWPERWLHGAGTEEEVVQDATLARTAFAAFSTGRHGCAGKELAYMEISLMMARLLYHYDIRLTDDATRNTVGEGHGSSGPWGRRIKGQFQIHDYFTGKGQGPWIQLRGVKRGAS